MSATTIDAWSRAPVLIAVTRPELRPLSLPDVSTVVTPARSAGCSTGSSARTTSAMRWLGAPFGTPVPSPDRPRLDHASMKPGTITAPDSDRSMTFAP